MALLILSEQSYPPIDRHGLGLKLTVARWVTPGGLDFGGVGVTPDVELDLEADIDAESLVEAVLSST